MADQKDDQVETSKAPLLDHLIELRQRLIYSFAAILLLFFVSYYFAEHIFAFLAQPLADILESKGGHRRMIFTGLHEAFFTYIKVSFFTALFIAFPVIATQVWRFVAPGLYKHEKKAFLPFLIATPVLFFLGGAFVYYALFPLAWKFFLSFEMSGAQGGLPIQLEAKVDQYLGLVMKLIFAFGLFFELPVVLTLLARIGMVTAEGLAKKRKYAILITFIAAALMTPPDVISQFVLAVPTLVLYEISIFLVRFIEKKKDEPVEEDAEETADESVAATAAGPSEPPDETDFNLR